MTKHVIEWFTAFDGTLFMHQDDCMNYELNYLYHKSGYRFYKDGKVLSKSENEKIKILWVSTGNLVLLEHTI